ncbi:MAG: hypothetical protein D6814_12005, partial [Calditrichaeota bacterium]
LLSHKTHLPNPFPAREPKRYHQLVHETTRKINFAVLEFSSHWISIHRGISTYQEVTTYNLIQKWLDIFAKLINL